MVLGHIKDVLRVRLTDKTQEKIDSCKTSLERLKFDVAQTTHRIHAYIMLCLISYYNVRKLSR